MELSKVLYQLKKLIFLLIFIAYHLSLITYKVQAQYDVCGDTVCSGSETCSNCPSDCGPCPTEGPGGSYENCGAFCCPGEAPPCSPPLSGYTLWCWPECEGGNAEVCYRDPRCYQPCPDCRNCGCNFYVYACPAGLCGEVHCNIDTGGCFSDCYECVPPETSPSPTVPTCNQEYPAAPSLTSPIDALTISPLNASQNFSWSDITDWGIFCCGATLECPDWEETCPDDPPGSPGYYYHAGETCSREIRFFINAVEANLFSSFTSLNYDAVSHTVSSLEPNNTYYWAVCSYNSVSPSCSEVREFTIENTSPMEATGGSHQEDLINNQVSFTWDHDDAVWGTHVGGNDYRFYLDWREDGDSYDWADPVCSDIAGFAGAGTSTYDSCGPFTFDWGTTYFWTVRTSNNGSDFTDYSPTYPNTWVDSAEWSFTANHGAWFQTAGGDVHADGSLSLTIPADSCVLPCEPYLLLNDSVSSYHGLLSYGTSYGLGDYADDSNMAEDGDDWYIQTNRDFPDYGYTNFWLDFLENDISGDYFTGGDIGGQSSGVYNMTGGNLNGNVASGEQIILLRDGDIMIDNNLTVDTGGFLMVVSNGTITISSSLSGSEINPAVQGVFIADIITTETTGANDSHLYAAGTFIGWNGISLQRELTAISNNTEPAETFIFRPDFIVNAPDWVKRSTLEWNTAIAP